MRISQRMYRRLLIIAVLVALLLNTASLLGYFYNQQQSLQSLSLKDQDFSIPERAGAQWHQGATLLVWGAHRIYPCHGCVDLVPTAALAQTITAQQCTAPQRFTRWVLLAVDRERSPSPTPKPATPDTEAEQMAAVSGVYLLAEAASRAQLPASPPGDSIRLAGTMNVQVYECERLRDWLATRGALDDAGVIESPEADAASGSAAQDSVEPLTLRVTFPELSQLPILDHYRQGAGALHLTQGRLGRWYITSESP